MDGITIFTPVSLNSHEKQDGGEMKFAFLIMGNEFDSSKDRAYIHDGMCQIIGVNDIEDAESTARKLLQEGIGCIEVCGAFGIDGAKAIINATENRIPVGYVTHLPSQEDLFIKAFGN